MDLSESLFTRFSNWRRRHDRKIEDSQAAFFDEEIEAIQLFFCSLYPQNNILFRKSEGIGSVSRGIVFLPEKIAFFSNPDLNRKVYLHKALVAAIICRHKISFLKGWEDKRKRVFQIYMFQDLFMEYLGAEYPSYDQFFSKPFQTFAHGNYKADKNDYVFKRWVANCKKLESGFSGEELRSHLENSYNNIGELHMSRLTYYPMAELMFFCGLMSHSQHELGQVDTSHVNKYQQKFETEIEGKSLSGVDLKVVDLDKKKEQENPIMHSFETLHTADEYQGGYRVSDASDELSDHQNALDELHLESVTRSGDQASSAYRAFIDGLVEVKDSFSKRTKGLPSKLYPEWDFKKQILKKDHCRLYFIDPCNSQAAASDDDVCRNWEAALKEKYSLEIARWKKKIEAVVNDEVWVNRQWNGEEIDLESYINFRGDLACGQLKESPVYLSKKKSLTNLSCLILFDQSFSTDSWIQNRRVLDIELEAIGLMGVLTDSFVNSIAVVGTWSETRNHCYFKLYKDFSRSWSQFYGVASEIAPMGYTRLGPALRHSVEKLSKMKAQKRLLIILTDGKPTDYDRYEGLYGIEDVRNAISGAEGSGVFVKALAIEKKNTAHLEQIFGKGRYEVINDVKKFSEVLLKILVEAVV